MADWVFGKQLKFNSAFFRLLWVDVKELYLEHSRFKAHFLISSDTHSINQSINIYFRKVSIYFSFKFKKRNKENNGETEPKHRHRKETFQGVRKFSIGDTRATLPPLGRLHLVICPLV